MKSTTPPKDYVKLTQEILSSKVDIFETFPCCIEKIIKEKIWAEVTDKKGDFFKSFEAFCKHPLWQGLELTVDELMSYLKKSPDIKGLVLGELDAMPESGGTPGNTGKSDKKNKVDNINLVDNVTKQNKGGDSPTYAMKRQGGKS